METKQTIETAVDEGMYRGFKVADLNEVFHLICNKQDWKAPIAVTCRGEEIMIIVAAIIFYTATQPTVSLDIDTMIYAIESVGYRMGPAGDH